MIWLIVILILVFSMGDYQKNQFRFNLKGVHLARSVDDIPQDKYRFLLNVRSYQQGVLQSRPGQTVLNSSAISDTNIHSIKKLEDDIPGSSQAQALIVGAGDELYSSNAGYSTLTSKDSGYSGDPLSMVVFRPNRSPKPWMYVSDRSRSRKIDVGGNDFAQGIANPTVEPNVTLTALEWGNIDVLSSAGSVTQGGTAGAPSTQARVNTTVNRILYDTGTSGWALIEPVAFTDDIQPYAQLFIDLGTANEEAFLVDSVYKAINNTTISGISYDSGSTGLCTITLTAPSREGLVPNAMIRINDGGGTAENVRILSVSLSPGGVPSFRCSTTNTHAAGETVTGIRVFRAFFLFSHVATDAIEKNCVQSTITAGTGTLSRTITFNISVVSGTSTRPVGPEDYLHIGIECDNLENLVEGRVMIDIDSTTNDFTKNYLYAVFRANDFVPAEKGTITQLTAKQRKLQRRLTDLERRLSKDDLPEKRKSRLQAKKNKVEQKIKELQDKVTADPGKEATDRPSDQTVTGASQWTEFRFKIGDLLRVGSDSSRGLRDGAAYRLSFKVTDSTVIRVNDLSVQGGYGPDVEEVGTPYIYRYRYRSSSTGARSNWSPQLRSYMLPHGQKMTLTPTTSGDGQVDKIDWIRFGGFLNDWELVGTQPNSGSFTDEYPDDELFGSDDITFDNYQPFPVTDIPKTGVCNVVGTSVIYVSGDAFNTSWPEGTIIVINSIPVNLYTNPSSTTRLQIDKSLGNLSNVSFFIPEPTIPGTPLPSFWGPYGQGEQGTVMFACGDLYNPGTIYWTNVDDPDSSSDKNFLEVTSPSEPLMNGFLYQGRCWVFSTDDLYVIYPSQTLEGRLTFKSSKIGLGMGLYARYGLCVGEGKVFFIGRDGIYVSEGSYPISITDDDLYPLFPHDGQVGSNINNYQAPDFTQTNFLRLSVGDGILRFDFKAIDGNQYTWIYDINEKCWDFDTYGRPILCSYFEEGKNVHKWIIGANNGKLYTLNGTSDDGIAISCQIDSPFFSMGDDRILKILGDIFLDCDPNNATISQQIFFDNGSFATLASNLPASASRYEPPTTLDINSGAGQLFRNLALRLTWNSTTATPRFYFWEPWFLVKVEDTFRRFSDYSDLGYSGPKYIRALRVRADTEGVDKSIRIQYDGVQVGTDIIVNHNGELWKSYQVDVPFFAYLVRTAPLDDDSWRFYEVEYIFDKYPDRDNIITEWTDGGYAGDKWLQGLVLRADTNNSAVTVFVKSDDGTTIATLVCTHNGDSTKPYSWTPYITHLMRLVPSGDIRIIEAKWVFEPEPENTVFWKAQPTSFGLDGYLHIPDCLITLRSSDTTVLTINIDGTDYSYNIASTGGELRKIYIPLQAIKGKVYQLSLVPNSGSIRVYQKDIEFRIKPWGSGGEYQTIKPLGHPHAINGALI